MVTSSVNHYGMDGCNSIWGNGSANRVHGPAIHLASAGHGSAKSDSDPKLNCTRADALDYPTEGVLAWASQ